MSIEFSAEREVRALGWAMRMIHARKVDDDGEAFRELEVAFDNHVAELDDPEELSALWLAFTRIATTLALEEALRTKTDMSEVLEQLHARLARASLETDQREPGEWPDATDPGADYAEAQMRYLRGVS